MDYRPVVLEYLAKNPNSKPIDIGKELHRVNPNIPATRKSANMILYKLLEKNKVQKITEVNGANPRWSLV